MWFQGFQKYGMNQRPERDRDQERTQQGLTQDQDRPQTQSQSCSQPTAENVHSLNQVVHFNPVTPSYPQDLSTRRVIDFVYLPHDEVLILASMDGQYPCWVSRTAISDIETNTAIANAVLFDDFTTFTSQFPLLNRLTQDCYRRRFTLSGACITTPFDYGFPSDPGQIKYWGRYVASGISSHYDRIKKLCTYRELDGQYLSFLTSYLSMLEVRTDDAVADYESNRILIDLLTDEDYLYVSDNEAIRSTYVQIRREIGSLYNSYMTIVR